MDDNAHCERWGTLAGICLSRFVSRDYSELDFDRFTDILIRNSGVYNISGAFFSNSFTRPPVAAVAPVKQIITSSKFF